LGWQHREAGKTSGIFLDDLTQPVINLFGQANGRIALERLNAGLDVREHLQVDARSVHPANSFAAHVGEVTFDHVE
jgi:hypothetical protein